VTEDIVLFHLRGCVESDVSAHKYRKPHAGVLYKNGVVQRCFSNSSLEASVSLVA